MSVPVQSATPRIEGGNATHDPAGEVRFVTREEAVRLRGALEAARLLVVSISEVGPGSRARLAEVIDDAIESALRDRGGAPPGISASSEPGCSLSDQLYRIRQIGRVGLAIDLGPMTALCDARGALEPEDGAALRFLAEATRDRPLVLLLDPSNAQVRLYGAPQLLFDALGLVAPTPPPSKPERRVPEAFTRGAMTPTPTPVRPVVEGPAATPIPQENGPFESPELTPESLRAAVELLEDVTRATPITGLESAFVDGYAPLRAAILEDRLSLAGIGRAEARSLCAQFATTFARSYGEALPTFGVTGRHPRMIFELFELAQRCARVHGARSTHVVIVDALRYDLGKRLRHRMGKVLARKAVCVEEHVLWSVLPTTTAVQLDALVRGEDALKSRVQPEKETSIIRGRSLDVLRRMRLGHRDVVKLDLLEGRLRDAGGPERERLDSLASELVPIVTRYLESLPTRTLVVVAGDHGFAFEDETRDDKPAPATSTPAGKQGGASPEEVFVPFAAWLVGGVH
jgi:hypothetical protein